MEWADDNKVGLCINESVSIFKIEPKSVVIWHTGVPTKSDLYLVTTTKGEVAFTSFLADNASDVDRFKEVITAWCPLSDIEPYKEE